MGPYYQSAAVTWCVFYCERMAFEHKVRWRCEKGRRVCFVYMNGWTRTFGVKLRVARGAEVEATPSISVILSRLSASSIDVPIIPWMILNCTVISYSILKSSLISLKND